MSRQNVFLKSPKLIYAKIMMISAWCNKNEFKMIDDALKSPDLLQILLPKSVPSVGHDFRR
eukprot:247926-Karenia_brevis.AAC.1